MNPCRCTSPHDTSRLVVLTGGPGAGKTAVLELVRRELCEHVQVLPEAAGIIWGGGFPRANDGIARMAAQRCIYRVQRELEWMVIEQRTAALALCDRGTLDGQAYWRGSPESFWTGVASTPEIELQRYAAVIHLRTPTLGYDHSNPLRTESVEEALALDARIAAVWNGHPRRFFVDTTTNFIDKATRAISLIRAELPECCRGGA